MTQALGKYAAKKILSKHMDKYKDKDPLANNDPYFEYIERPGRNGKMKKKKVKKQIPDYIPEHDAIILAKMRQRAYALDCCLFSIMGVRFGWSSVIGIVPAAGDMVDGSLALLLILRCWGVDCGISTWGKIHMLFNLVFDFLVGLIPILGDLLDAGYKCNTKNLRILEKELDKAYRPKATPEPATPATVYEDFSSDDEGLPTRNGDGRTERYEPRKPEPVRQKTETRAGPSIEKSRGWFSSGSRREREPDLERGNTWKL